MPRLTLVPVWLMVVASLGAISRATPLLGEKMSDQDVAPVYDGPVVAVDHPRGWFTIDLPAGWSVARQHDDAWLVDPGLPRGGELEALVLLSFGELEAGQAGRDVARLFAEVRGVVVEQLAAQSIVVDDTGVEPRAIRTRHADGVVHHWQGRAAGRDVRVFFGGLVVEASYFTVTAVAVAGKEAPIFSRARRVLESVVPRPPGRDPGLEASLVGAEFFVRDVRPGGRGSSSTRLEFFPELRVRRTITMSGPVGLGPGIDGESTTWGTYGVVGDEVTVSVEGAPEILRIVVDQGRIVALDDGRRRYGRR